MIDKRLRKVAGWGQGVIYVEEIRDLNRGYCFVGTFDLATLFLRLTGQAYPHPDTAIRISHLRPLETDPLFGDLIAVLLAGHQ